MTRFAIFIFVFFFATASTAEPVRVSAGEHEDFTRLLLEFNERPVWDMRRRGVGYRITFSSSSVIGFDLSRVFRLIDRSRVGDIRTIGNNTIEIDVACACDLHISETGNAALVVDVRDQKDRAVAQNTALLPDHSSHDGSSEIVGSGLSRESFGPAHGPLPEVPARQHILPELKPRFQSDLPAPGLVTDRSVAVELVGRALSRAASQGLVTANEEISPINRMFQRLDNLDVLTERGNLSVTTGFDRETRPDLPTIPPTDTGTICLNERQIDVRNWGDAQNADQLGQLRGAAVAEDGSIDPSGALRLARYYIYLSFGAEARAVSQFLPASDDRDILIALADIVDEGRSESEILNGQVACSGAVSLWATLAKPLTSDNAPESTDAMLSAFSALPPHLRSHLGPLLSERLHDIGLQEQARTALNAITRGGTRTDESDLATARLELEGTHAESARNTLADLSNGTDITAAGALLELLRDAESREMAPNPAWVDDAPTLVGALEGTEIAEDLNLAGLRGLIALGRFDEFRKAIVETSPGVNQKTRGELAVLALRTATRSGSDVAFLASELGLSKIVDPAMLDRDTRLAIASRLADLGLSVRALTYVGGEPESPEDLALVVDVYLASGRLDDALAIARATPFHDDSGLLARALAVAGELPDAVAAFDSAGDRDEALDAAIRIGDWAWITENGTQAYADAARTLASPTKEVAPDTETPNGTLIDMTRTRRAQVRALLELTEPVQPAFTN